MKRIRFVFVAAVSVIALCPGQRSTASRASTPGNQLGYGVVNALAAVQAITPLPTANASPPPD